MALEIDRLSGPTSSAQATSSRSLSARASDASVSRPSTFDRLFADRAQVGPRERMFFTERLALLLETGVPLHLALESLAAQASGGAIARIALQLNEDVKGGSSFGRALASHPNVFPTTYVNLIAAAESGGFLPVALERLRDMEERQEELRATLRSALSYPAMLTVFSFAVVVFVLTVVFPKFEEIFAVLADDLPFTTRWLMTASDLLRDGWPILLLGGGALAWAGSAWLARPEGRARLDRGLLTLPVVGEIVVQLNVVQLLRVAGLSLANGVGLLEALRAAREAVGSPYFKRFIDRVCESVSGGQGLRTEFNAENRLPDLVKQMIETGEETGNLPMVMQRLADFYEREWRRALDTVAKLAEPVMLVVMGCVVGLIVSSLILPIFKISRAVH